MKGEEDCAINLADLFDELLQFFDLCQRYRKLNRRGPR